jgi:hypothetical protein
VAPAQPHAAMPGMVCPAAAAPPLQLAARGAGLPAPASSSAGALLQGQGQGRPAPPAALARACQPDVHQPVAPLLPVAAAREQADGSAELRPAHQRGRRAQSSQEDGGDAGWDGAAG